MNSLLDYTPERKELTHQSTRNAAEQSVVTCEETLSLVGYNPVTCNLYRLQKSTPSTSDDTGKVIVSCEGLPGDEDTEYRFQPLILCF